MDTVTEATLFILASLYAGKILLRTCLVSFDLEPTNSLFILCLVKDESSISQDIIFPLLILNDSSTLLQFT